MAGDRGPIETSVYADLTRLRALESQVGVRGTLAEMAIRLAVVIDAWDGSGSAAALSAMARAHQELRATLAALMEVADDGDDGEAERLSTPQWSGVPAAVRDATQPGAGDAGAAGR